MTTFDPRAPLAAAPDPWEELPPPSLRDPAAGRARVAYAVSRAVGGAVDRNRLRRRLRAIVHDAELVPGTYLVAVAPAAAMASFHRWIRERRSVGRRVRTTGAPTACAAR